MNRAQWICVCHVYAMCLLDKRMCILLLCLRLYADVYSNCACEYVFFNALCLCIPCDCYLSVNCFMSRVCVSFVSVLRVCVYQIAHFANGYERICVRME